VNYENIRILRTSIWPPFAMLYSLGKSWDHPRTPIHGSNSRVKMSSWSAYYCSSYKYLNMLSFTLESPIHGPKMSFWRFDSQNFSDVAKAKIKASTMLKPRSGPSRSQPEAPWGQGLASTTTSLQNLGQIVQIPKRHILKRNDVFSALAVPDRTR